MAGRGDKAQAIRSDSGIPMIPVATIAVTAAVPGKLALARGTPTRRNEAVIVIALWVALSGPDWRVAPVSGRRRIQDVIVPQRTRKEMSIVDHSYPFSVIHR